MRQFLAILFLLLLPSLAHAADYASALLMDAASGQILQEENADLSRSPASVVKLMLLLLAREAQDQGRVSPETLLESSSLAQSMGGSQVYLAKGDKTSFQRLIEAVALGSANDAAVTVAEGLFGSIEETLAAMNNRAAGLGMESSQYANVTGLPASNGMRNLTSARDQAILAREVILHYPGVLEWTSKTWTRFRRGLVLANTNTVLKKFKGMDGLKTGYHDEARSNLVASAERNGRRLIAVVLGAESQDIRDNKVVELLESGFQDWTLRLALRKNDGLGVEFPVRKSWKGRVRVAAAADLQYLVRKEDLARGSISLDRAEDLSAPIREGEVLGEIQVLLEGEVLASVPALAQNSVRKTWISRK